MAFKLKPAEASCPASANDLEQRARQTLEALLDFCRHGSSTLTFWQFEKALAKLLASLALLLIRLFLRARHTALPLQTHLADGRYRLHQDEAPRQLKTAYGKLTYHRAYLVPKKGGSGWAPLDALLGLTQDTFSPGLIALVCRLATRLSYPATRQVVRWWLGWAPSSSAIEQLVLGVGRQAAAYVEQAKAPTDEGEVLVLEVDGKCTPTATEAELAKRRRPRRPRHQATCPCGCQRHRGRQRRQARGSRPRRRRGDKSKNGQEVTVVVMYTLRRGADGRLHGPINKQVWASYGGRPAACAWARRQATKRGFPPQTDKQVQVVIDGVRGLRQRLQKHFPKAWFVLDVRHVEEKLWASGRAFHAEGSVELAHWVRERQQLLYEGKSRALLRQLRQQLATVPSQGPGNKGKRQALTKLINYLEPRLDMLRYDELRQRDLVIASGQVEGAVRHVVGERLDCAGMRWTPERAEALLHLRCLEINGEWDKFFAWLQQGWCDRLAKGEAVRIRTQEPLKLDGVKRKRKRQPTHKSQKKGERHAA